MVRHDVAAAASGVIALPWPTLGDLAGLPVAGEWAVISMQAAGFMALSLVRAAEARQD